MTLLSDTTAPTTTTLWRKRAGLAFATVILGAGLTACGSSPGDTTCGEFKDMSSDDQISLIEDEVDDSGTDEEKKAFEDAPDEAKQAAADAVVAQCEGEDDDTKLDDI